MIFALAILSSFIHSANAVMPTTLEVKKQGEQAIRQVIEPLLTQYCREKCQIIHVDLEVDVAVSELAAPGFEEGGGKATLAPASGKVKLLIDETFGNTSRNKVVALLNEHLQTLDFPVQIDTKMAAFPQPASSNYRIADLREKVSRDIRASIQSLISQFCPSSCLLGEFEVQTEVVNPDEVNYSSSQEYFQDGPAAIRVRGVKATLMTDQAMAPEEANGILEMAKLKVAQYKNSSIVAQSMKFPKLPIAESATGAAARAVASTKDSLESKESKDSHEVSNRTENSKDVQTLNDTQNHKISDNKQEKFEHYEKIERVENGDAVQATLDKFRLYGIILAAIMLALLITLVAISFRKQIFDSSPRHSDAGPASPAHSKSGHSSEENAPSMSEEKASLLGRRIETERYFNDLTHIFSEQPKVAKHVFTHVLTEEGVETTAQYLEIFGESVVMDLLRDPGLQADLSELMEFYARNTFEISEEERLLLLKKLHHRTVTAKMQVHGSRSAALFDYLTEMDAPQILEMIKNESNTVKAIVLTQCDQKKRQSLFNSHDETTRMKLMTELSRIDHLPKTYIFNVATALRRKKSENPKLNTEALPGTDVLVSFLEKSDLHTQKTIVHQLMGTAGIDALQNLKSKLVSIETLRFLKTQALIDIITQVKHDELIRFMQGCSAEVSRVILEKAPEDLSVELSDALKMSEPASREIYLAVERKILNRLKVLVNNGQVNLAEVNERIFAGDFGAEDAQTQSEVHSIDMRKVG